MLVFGPGTGEFVAVRAPGGHWLIVDGCRRQGTMYYGQHVLDHYGARAAIVVLTHPHRDHASGVAELVEAATRGPKSEWPLLGLLPPIDLPSDDTAPAAEAYATGIAEHAIATIQERWRAHSECRWEMPVGDVRALGPAKVIVLSPESTAASADLNERATALAIEWEANRVVLGADLAPEKRWAEALLRAPDVATHRALKIPHHGSIQALHAPLLAVSTSALRVATPYASSDLPRFDAAGSIAYLHKSAPDVHLTALPRRYSAQGGAGGVRLKRAELETQGRGLGLDPVAPGFPDCFVAIEWDAAGGATVHHGAGSVIVTR